MILSSAIPSLTRIDEVILASTLLFTIGLGLFIAARMKSADGFFLGGRSMPGWVVGISIMTSMISSLSFVAIPAFTFKENYRWITGSVMYAVLAIPAMYFFMPFFRRIRTPSGYEYLERRFGAWARIFLAGGYVLFEIGRMGIVLYAVSLPFEAITGIHLPWLILIIGIIAASYTVLGGLEALIWMDLLQAFLLILGAFICLPVVVSALPGGLGQIVTEAHAAGKMSLGDMDFSFTKMTFWVMLIGAVFGTASGYTTTQHMIQRYRAPKSEKEARIAIGVGAFSIVPVWLYFSFLGTALWVFYQHFPSPQVAAFADKTPEKIVPFFIFTQIAPGLRGLVLAGMIQASLGTLNAAINACAATVTGDFYERFFVKNRSSGHYLKVGRWLSAIFSVLMILMAIVIYNYRDATLQDLQALLQMILSAGTFGLFLVGFITKKVDSRSALFASVITVAGTAVWVILGNSVMEKAHPILHSYVPDLFWIPVFSNLLLLILAYAFAVVMRRENTKDLTDLTLHTLSADASHGAEGHAYAAPLDDISPAPADPR